MHPRFTPSTTLSSWGLVPDFGLTWRLLVIKTLPALRSSFVSPVKGHSYCSLSIVLENEHAHWAPWFVSAELYSLSCGIIFRLWDSGCLVFSSFTGSQICRVAQSDSEFPSSDPGSDCSPVPTDLEELSRRGHWSLCGRSPGPEALWLPPVPPSPHAPSRCSKRIVFLLISTQAHPLLT